MYFSLLIDPISSFISYFVYLSEVVGDMYYEPPGGSTALPHAQVTVLHRIVHLLAQCVLQHIPVLRLPTSKR